MDKRIVFEENYHPWSKKISIIGDVVEICFTRYSEYETIEMSVNELKELLKNK